MRGGWILALTSVGFFMSMMDSMIVTTASTAIQREFAVDIGRLQWTLNAYIVAVAAFLLVGVSMGNRIGHRRLYVIGLLVFTASSVACALSPNLSALIVARAMQGIGASVMTPMSMTILASAYPANQRGKALGIWGGIGGLALIIGPALGGIIVAYMSWQWIFWINVPLGLLTIILSTRKLPESVLGGDMPNLWDSLLIMGAFGLIIWALSEFISPARNREALIAVVVGVLLLMAFLFRQKHSPSPMVPLTLFSSPAFTAGVTGTLVLYAAMSGVIFFLPQYLQAVTGASSLTAGLELLPWTATLVFCSPFAGAAADRLGVRPIAVISFCLQCVGYAWIALVITPSTPYPALVAPLIVSGVGISMAGPALQKAVLAAVNLSQMSIASGVFNTFRQFGSALGTSMSVILFSALGNSTTRATFVSGFAASLMGSAILALIGGACALALRSPNKRLPLP